jgi:hypothetical protein
VLADRLVVGGSGGAFVLLVWWALLDVVLVWLWVLGWRAMVVFC